jgi:1-acyl-sn-glycerol-3-phosphate acyltransferase
MFDPKCDKFPYPMDTGSHYLNVKSEINLNLDENYSYIDESKKFTKKLKWFRFVLRLIVFPMTKIRLNLKVKGKKNLIENKELLSNGCITVCNHVHMWDFLAIMYALRKTDIKFLAWKENMEASNRNLVKLAGGIPIPDGNMKG